MHKLKPRFARFQLECPMPIALRAPSREYMSRFVLHLGFLLVLNWIDKDWLAVLLHTSAHRPCVVETDGQAGGRALTTSPA